MPKSYEVRVVAIVQWPNKSWEGELWFQLPFVPFKGLMLEFGSGDDAFEQEVDSVSWNIEAEFFEVSCDTYHDLDNVEAGPQFVKRYEDVDFTLIEEAHA